MLSVFLQRCAKLLNRESLVFLFLLLLSAMFWAFTVLNERCTRELRFPIALVDVPENYVILEEVPAAFSVIADDTRLDFLKYTWAGLDTIKIDFESHRRASGEIVVPAAELQKLVIQQLGQSIRVQSVNKREGLIIPYIIGKHKRLPIRLIKSARAQTVELKAIPDTVDVFAAREKLRDMWEISLKTESIDTIIYNDTTTRTLVLEPVKGVKFKPDSVTVRITPVLYVKKTLEVPVTCINEPENSKLRLFPPRVSINFMVDMRMYSSVKEEAFAVTADFNEVADKQKAHCTLRLTKKPNYVNNAKLSVDEVSYLIEER